MTLNELIEKMADEICEVCKDDESKFDVFEEFNEMIISAQQENKIDGYKLFETCNRLNSVFPDYVSALLALSVIAKIGVDSGLAEHDDIESINVNDVITGVDDEEED